MERICKENKIKDVTSHGLRHTHATILIKQKTPVKTISERLGNTVKMVYRVYGHNFDELEREAVQDFVAALQVV